MKHSKASMLQGSAVKSILLFALPILFASLLQFNYTLVDNIIVGRYVGKDALAAVGNVGSINSFIIGAALGLTSGFTIPVAHAFGAGDKEKVSRYSGSSISLAFLIGSIIVIIAHIISTPLLKLIGTPDEIIGLSASYVNILYFGVPLQMLSNNFTAISRAVGESKKPLYFFTASVCVNFILDILFVKNFGWGVEGAAIATLISHLTACILTGFYIFKINEDVELRPSSLKLKKKTVIEQLKLGIPVSLQFTITSIGTMCLQSAINSFGANVMAGLTAASRVENVTNISMSAIGVSTQTFVGQNYGAKNYKRITDSVKKMFFLELAISVVMSIILITVGPHIVSVFITIPNEEMLFASKRYLLAIAECYSLVSILFILRNTLQGLGFTYANAVAGAGELIGRILVSIILVRFFGFDIVIYAAPTASLMADIPLAIIYLKKQKEFKKLTDTNND
ncbi:MAG: MATE family efflux transporter [Clostridia bacterium]|nr:MATE family efflux transporter [Clostridia bacterium]